MELVSAVKTAKALRMSRARLKAWTDAGIIPALSDPETGRTVYSLTAIEAWQRRLGELAAEQQKGSAA